MEALKATKAREITKESVTEAEMVVNGVSVSKLPENPMQAGDFYFRSTLVQRIVKVPWYLRLLGEKTHIGNEIVDTIVISCPGCGLPILTHPFQKVLQRRPLTIEGTIACPYAPQGMVGGHAFFIKDGNIMPA